MFQTFEAVCTEPTASQEFQVAKKQKLRRGKHRFLLGEKDVFFIKRCNGAGFLCTSKYPDVKKGKFGFVKYHFFCIVWRRWKPISSQHRTSNQIWVARDQAGRLRLMTEASYLCETWDHIRYFERRCCNIGTSRM
jgi:YD repeat-containing protein